MSRWLLVRHGESTANAARRLSGSQDVPLTERGAGQAEAAGREMDLSRVRRVLSSDLRRARRTADIALGAWSARWASPAPPVFEDPAFQERDFGPFQGEDKDELKARGIMRELQRWSGVPDGVESYADLARRVLPALDAWHLQGDQVLFAHGGVIRVILGLSGEGSLGDIALLPVENASPMWVENPPGGWAPLLERVERLCGAA